DLSLGGRHPLPTVEAFAQTLADLGISKDKHIVLYDDKSGSNAAARFWWMLKSAGHEKVQVLNGGLSQAKKDLFPMSSKAEAVKRAPVPYPVERWCLPTMAIHQVEEAAQN